MKNKSISDNTINRRCVYWWAKIYFSRTKFFIEMKACTMTARLRILVLLFPFLKF